MKKILSNEKYGFSLIEMMLVLVIISLMFLSKMQDIRSEQIKQEGAVQANKMKTIAGAVNGYINMNYADLIALKNDGADKICDDTTKTCEIKLSELKKFSLLPETFNPDDRMLKNYKIVLKRSGAEPNYMINGIITADADKQTDKVFLGTILSDLGIDGGVSKGNDKISGFRGFWSETSADFKNINGDHQLAARVGYDSNMYSIYLRRDGTLPMTGNLNMGTNDINNAKDLNLTNNANIGNDVKAKGYVRADKNIEAGGWLSARNGYGDVINIGGDKGQGDANDFEIMLNADKRLTVFSSKTSNQDTERFRVIGTSTATGNIVADKNVVAKNRVGAGSSPSNLAAYIEQSGNIYASKEIKGKTIVAEDSMYIQKQITLGTSCSTIGLMGRTADGNLASCVKGIWAQPSAGEYVEANISVPASGSVNFKNYLPTAKAIQIRYFAGIEATGNCCPEMRLSMDGKLIMMQGFDTTASKERIALASTIIISNGTHNFSWSLTRARWHDYQPSIQIVGYFK